MSTSILELIVSFYSGIQTVYVPEGCIPLKILVKHGTPFMLFRRPYHSSNNRTMRLQVVTVGQEIPDNCYYIDSVIAPGDVVYSFFEMEN